MQDSIDYLKILTNMGLCRSPLECFNGKRELEKYVADRYHVERWVSAIGGRTKQNALVEIALMNIVNMARHVDSLDRAKPLGFDQLFQVVSSALTQILMTRAMTDDDGLVVAFVLYLEFHEVCNNFMATGTRT